MDTKDFEEVSRSEYDRLIRGVGEITSLRLLSIHSERKQPNPKGTLSIKVGHNSGEKIVEELTILVANPSFRISTVDEGGAEVFIIEASFEVKYRITALESFPEDVLAVFLSTNVMINLWPYVRELVSSISVRMGYPPLLLEPLRTV